MILKREVVGNKANSRFVSEVKKNIFPDSKRSQVTIFVILGILVIIVLFLLFGRGTNVGSIFAARTPVQEIEDCVKNPISEGIGILSLQGGNINPENYYLYEGNKVEYVCYAEENFENCVMQKPILINTIEDELENYALPKVRECVNSFKSEFESKGYQVSMKDPEIEVEIVPDNVLIDMDIDLSISKDGTESYDNIRTGVKSKIYNFVMIASSIMSWETKFGDSETLNYMLLYPSLKVEKKKQGDGSKIYILTERDTNEQFMFAVRSLVIPPGMIEVR